MTILWQLDDVALGARLCAVTARIDPGVTAVIGPSGAGKTSLLDVLVGFEVPTAGTVARDGPARAPAWVPSDDGLWPHLSARAHLETVGAAPTDVAELLEALELDQRAGARPAELSRGERARLSVARALATGSRALVMDEPLAHVDPARLDRTWRTLLMRVAARGASLVFASHDPASVLRAAERVIHLEEGRVTFAGTTAELYDRPPTLELALALGPANWIDAETAARFLTAPLAGPCVRPERVRIEPADASPVTVEAVEGTGPLAEVALRHESGAATRLWCCNPPVPAPGAPVWVRLLGLVAALLLGPLSACGGGEAALEVAAVHHVAIPPDGTRAPAPRAIAPGADGELLVLDNAGRVLVLDADGVLVRQWRMPENDVGNPEGICRLQDGRIVVADTHYSRLVVFDDRGELLRTLGEEGTGPGQFLYPVRVIQDPAGFVYVAEYGSNDRVQKLTSDLEFVLAFGRFGTEPGAFQRANGLAWRDGLVYVSDAVNMRVQAFRDDGEFVGVVGGADAVELRFPYDLCLGPDDLLYVAEYGAGRVTALTLDGALVGRVGSSGTGAGQLATPWALTAVRRGEGIAVWVADTGNRRLVRFER